MSDYINNIKELIDVPDKVYLKIIVTALFFIFLYLPILLADIFEYKIYGKKLKNGTYKIRLCIYSLIAFGILNLLLWIEIKNFGFVTYVVLSPIAICAVIIIYRYVKKKFTKLHWSSKS